MRRLTWNLSRSAKLLAIFLVVAYVFVTTFLTISSRGDEIKNSDFQIQTVAPVSFDDNSIGVDPGSSILLNKTETRVSFTSAKVSAVTFTSKNAMTARSTSTDNVAVVTLGPDYYTEENTSHTQLVTPAPIESTSQVNDLLSRRKSPWSWTCGKDKKCHRVRRNSSEPFLSLDTCWLTCSGIENLWPKPQQSTSETEDSVGIKTMNFAYNNLILKSIKVTRTSSNRGEKTKKVIDLGQEAFDIMKQNVKLLLPSSSDYKTTENDHPGTVFVSVRITSSDPKLSLVTDESYTLKISPDLKNVTVLQVLISAETFFGARHGLETLSQLIVFNDSTNQSLQILTKVFLSDGPAFPYRGLMIDTARNFIPLESLKRMVDGMAANKLNILHWHLTDSNSFPLFCPSFPQMTEYGAYTEEEIYYPEQIKKFIQYALVRGVKVIPEIDAPAHAGNGWQWGTVQNGFDKLALCVNEEPFNGKCGQPPCGQLNPVNPKVYEVLGGIYRDIFDTFDSDMFHMGGDEVTYTCWQTKEIKTFARKMNFTNFIQLRVYFQQRALEQLNMAARDKLKTPPIPIIWTSDLTTALPILENSRILPTDYIIQTWEETTNRDVTKRELLAANFPMIISDLDDFYLDLGGGSWLGMNHDWRYINWQKLYKYSFEAHGYDTTKLVNNSRLGRIPQILGGEAPLWTEKVGADTMDAKLWPRGSAFAERLWLNPDKNNTKSPLVYARLLRQNERLRRRGIRVSTQQPKSCLLIHGNCQNLMDPEPIEH